MLRPAPKRRPLVVPWADLPARAYAAGLLDGEGYLQIARTISPRATFPSYTLSVRVANTSYEMMLWLWNSFGGTIYHHTYAAERRREGWQWSVNGEDAALMALATRRYLVTKQAQADLLLELWRIKANRRCREHGSRLINADDDAASRELFERARCR